MKPIAIALALVFALAGCGAAERTNTPANIRSFDVIDNHGLRHTCIEDTSSGELTCG